MLITPTTANRAGSPPGEVAEETRLIIPSLGRKLWIRESRFHYEGRDHHREGHVFLGRITDIAPDKLLAQTARFTFARTSR